MSVVAHATTALWRFQYHGQLNMGTRTLMTVRTRKPTPTHLEETPQQTRPLTPSQIGTLCENLRSQHLIYALLMVAGQPVRVAGGNLLTFELLDSMMLEVTEGNQGWQDLAAACTPSEWRAWMKRVQRLRAEREGLPESSVPYPGADAKHPDHEALLALISQIKTAPPAVRSELKRVLESL